MIHARKDYQRIQDPEGKIPEDEPVFLLRAQDPIASMVVRAWARLYLTLEYPDKRVADAAMHHAWRMDQWPIKKKIADLPESEFTEEK